MITSLILGKYCSSDVGEGSSPRAVSRQLRKSSGMCASSLFIFWSVFFLLKQESGFISQSRAVVVVRMLCRCVDVVDGCVWTVQVVLILKGSFGKRKNMVDHVIF